MDHASGRYDLKVTNYKKKIPDPDDSHARYVRPELLQHPNIPKPMHGMAPRVVLGEKFWDETRKTAYRDNNWHCAACGIHFQKAWKYQRPECHEDYVIDYKEGRMYINKYIALCHACHQFIHCGRAGLKLDKEDLQYIVTRGWRILKEHRLYVSRSFYTLYEDGEIPEPQHFWLKERAYKEGFSFGQDWYANEERPWSEWRLVVDNKEYKPRFKSAEEWLSHYGCGCDEPEVDDDDEMSSF